MFGPPGHVQSLALGGLGGLSGVIPRAIADLFGQLGQLRDGSGVTVYCSFVQASAPFQGTRPYRSFV